MGHFYLIASASFVNGVNHVFYKKKCRMRPVYRWIRPGHALLSFGLEWENANRALPCIFRHVLYLHI
jgi:hypothetical protein